MGNPAGMRRKKSEKRRAKFEARLGGGILAYVPKELRDEVLAAEAAMLKAAATAEKKK